MSKTAAYRIQQAFHNGWLNAALQSGAPLLSEGQRWRLEFARIRSRLTTYADAFAAGKLAALALIARKASPDAEGKTVDPAETETGIRDRTPGRS